VLRLQEDAGLEVVTDGEMRRLSFQSQLPSAVDGFGEWDIDAFLWGEWHSDELGDMTVERPPIAVVGPLRRRRSLSGEELAYARSRTDRVLKVTLPSPSLFANFYDPERSRELYAPTYAKAFTILEPEIAAFRRGDSTLVVAAYDVAQDTLFRSRPLAAALVLARGEHDSLVVEQRGVAGPSGVLIATAPWGARLASLEIIDEPRAAGRGRVALAARDPDSTRVALSDLLFFEPPDSLPGDLAAVLPYVHTATTVPRGRRLGLYWEVYGLQSGEPAAISVSVQQRGKGLLRRAAESVGLATTSPPLQLEWHERMREPAGLAARSLEVDVSTLRPGRYRITVSVAPTGRKRASASRELHIVRSR